MAPAATQCSRGALWLEPTVTSTSGFQDALSYPRQLQYATYLDPGMLQTILNCHSLPLWGEGKVKEKKTHCDYRRKHWQLFPCWLRLQNRSSRKCSWDLLHGSKPETMSVFVWPVTLPAGLTEQVQKSLPAFSEAFHRAYFPLPGANDQGLSNVATCTGQGLTLVWPRPRLSTIPGQWTLTLDPWRAVFLWNLWLGHSYYWSILPQIRSWQQIHLLTFLA